MLFPIITADHFRQAMIRGRTEPNAVRQQIKAQIEIHNAVKKKLDPASPPNQTTTHNFKKHV